MRAATPLVPLVLLLLAVACGPAEAPPKPDTPPVPPASRDDSIELTLRALDGTELELSSLQGKVVIVDLWATWCGPCLRALPGLVRLSQARPDEIVVIGLSTDRDRGALQGFLKNNPLPYFVAVADRQAQMTFRTTALPTVFVLDKSGRLVETLVGLHPESHLEEVAERYL